ncbi:MAG: hypothetical protein J0H09_06545 [Burkholderiales bacterium]|nr:hypothetical protein [Burkholderiales bacterium]
MAKANSTVTPMRKGGTQPEGADEATAAEQALLMKIQNIDVLVGEASTEIEALARSIRLILRRGSRLEDAYTLARMIECRAGDIENEVNAEAERVGANEPIEENPQWVARHAIADRFRNLIEAEAGHVE